MAAREQISRSEKAGKELKKDQSKSEDRMRRVRSTLLADVLRATSAAHLFVESGSQFIVYANVFIGPKIAPVAPAIVMRHVPAADSGTGTWR